MKTIKPLFFIAFFNSISYAQVGIGTTSPTQEIDIVGNARVRGLSNPNGLLLDVYAQADGTLVTALNNANVPGSRFVGLIESDILLTDSNFIEIMLSSEFLDVLNEYDIPTGRYIPTVSGKYKILMNFDLGDYKETYYDIDLLIGLWDFADNKWIARRTLGHKCQLTFSLYGRNEGYSYTNYVDLDSTHSYGFRVYPTYNASSSFVDPTNICNMKAINTGSTGSTSVSTTFSIEKAN